MKRQILFAAILFVGYFCKAQEYFTPLPAASYPEAMLANADQTEYRLAGQRNHQAYIWTYSCKGDSLAGWGYGAEIGGVSRFYQILAHPDGGYLAAGSCTYCGKTPTDTLSKIVLARIDSEGNATELVKLDKLCKSFEKFQNPFMAWQGEYIYLLASAIDDIPFQPSNLALVKLDADLNLLWKRCTGRAFYDTPTDFLADEEGLTIVSTGVQVLFGPDTTWIARTNLEGMIQWREKFPGRSFQAISWGEDELLVAGSVATNGVNKRDLWLARLDYSDGDIIQQSWVGDTLDDQPVQLRRLANGQAILLWQSNRIPFSVEPYAQVSIIDPADLSELPQTDTVDLSAATGTWARDIIPTGANGQSYSLAGFFGGFFFGLENQGGFYYRVGDCPTQIRSLTRSNQPPSGFSVFPNPTEGPVAIQFPEDGSALVRIFDSMGRLIWTDRVNRGEMWHAPWPAAGIYEIVAETPAGLQVQRVVVK